MRLPTQPRTLKPKIKTIANTIQSRFTPPSSLRPQRGMARISAAISRPRVASARAIATTIGS